MEKQSSSRRVENKRARFDYEINETFEAGLVLTGPEVKAFRSGHASLNAGFVRPLFAGAKNPELWLINAHFSKTDDPERSKKLLVHKHELERYMGKINEKGLTLIPLEMYFKRGNVKVLVGLGRGKKNFEKRDTIKKRDLNREMKRDTLK